MWFFNYFKIVPVAVRDLDFGNSGKCNSQLGSEVSDVSPYQHLSKLAKTLWRYGYFSIFLSTILDLQIPKILMAGQVQRCQVLHHQAKFSQNRSKGCGHNLAFTLFKIVIVRHL